MCSLDQWMVVSFSQLMHQLDNSVSFDDASCTFGFVFFDFKMTSFGVVEDRDDVSFVDAAVPRQCQGWKFQGS